MCTAIVFPRPLQLDGRGLTGVIGNAIDSIGGKILLYSPAKDLVAPAFRLSPVPVPELKNELRPLVTREDSGREEIMPGIRNV